MTQQQDLVKDRLTQWLPTTKDPHTITVHPSRLLIAQHLTQGTPHTVKHDDTLHPHTIKANLTNPTT